LGAVLILQALPWIMVVYIAVTAVLSVGPLQTWTPVTMAEHRNAYLLFYIVQVLAWLAGFVPCS
jgi:hypothetical protein